MFGILDNVFKLVEDVATIAIAPVVVVAEVASAVVHPIAEGAIVVIEEVKDLLD
jgi:hypothetical protein